MRTASQMAPPTASALALLNYLFAPPSPAPICFDAADANDDGGLDLSDAIFLIRFLFAFDCQPPAPYPGCGNDVDDNDLLGCASYPVCP